MTLNATARIAALSAMAVGLAGTAACSDEDLASPFVLGAQWVDPDVGEATVVVLDTPPAQEVVDNTGAPVEFGASSSLSTSVAAIQVVFSEPLNADVIEDLEINETDPVDLDAGIINRKSKFNPGVIAFHGRTGLVQIVDAETGETFEAVAEYFNNVRADVSIVFKDVGLSVTPLDVLPSGAEMHLRIFAGEIKDRDGNVLRAAERTVIPADGGRAEPVGIVTDSRGNPIAAVAVFATDPIAVATVTGPALPTDDDGNVTGTVTADDPETFENEEAIVVDFNTTVEPAGVEDAFILTAAGSATPIPFTVVALETGSTVDEDGNPDPEAEAEPVLTSVQIVPTVPLAEGDYELRIDPGFADTFGNDDPDAVPQIFEFTVE